MQSQRQRKHRRRDAARAWIRSGAKVTVYSYAKRFGVDRYSAYADLTALGVALPDSARQWAQRPPSNPRRAAHGDDVPFEDPWVMLDGRRFFVAGFTAGGAPYGIFEDEIEQMEPCDLDKDELLHDGLDDGQGLRDFRAVDDDCPF
jgi:hypothetical protein